MEVRYYDALSAEVREAQGARLQQFAEHRWPYPISVVGGEVVSVGGISVFGLLQVIDRLQRRNGDGHPE